MILIQLMKKEIDLGEARPMAGENYQIH